MAAACGYVHTAFVSEDGVAFTTGRSDTGETRTARREMGRAREAGWFLASFALFALFSKEERYWERARSLRVGVDCDRSAPAALLWGLGDRHCERD
jgi:hypothetical protein